MSTNTAITKQEPMPDAYAIMGATYNVDPGKLVTLLKGTVIKPAKQSDGSYRQATNEEVTAFIIVANQYKLNPFTRQIYAFADSKRGVVPIVPIDGWAHIVNGHSEFDGCDFQFERASDGKPISCTCTMFVKGRQYPITVTEYMTECFRPTDPWRGMPNRMLRHKAFMQAARLAFSISGIHDEDEAHDIVGDGELRQEVLPLAPPVRRSALPAPKRIESEPVQSQPPTGDEIPFDEAPPVSDEPAQADTNENPWPPSEEPPPSDTVYDNTGAHHFTKPAGMVINEPQRKRFFAKWKSSGKDEEAVKAHLLTNYGISSSKDITKNIYDELCEWADEK